jgi:hypothetical protein
MMTGQPGAPRRDGIWNCTYICPIVICCGVRGGVGWPGGAPGTAAYSLTFATPPTKKLPWSSSVTGPPMKRFGAWPWHGSVAAATRTAVARGMRGIRRTSSWQGLAARSMPRRALFPKRPGA